MIKRKLSKRVLDRIRGGKAIILYGPRQAGKTTMMQALLSDKKAETLFLNGDEPDVREMLSDVTSVQLKNLVGRHKIVFIDEAQRIRNIGITLKLFTDQLPDIQVIATGSSVFELANKTSEALTGRKYEVLLLPMAFEELVEENGWLEERRHLEQRLVYGCFPEIITNPEDARELLKLLAGSYLYKDLLTLGNINKPELLDKILRALALQIGNEVNYSELGQLIGADNQTVGKYIDLLEKAFVLFKLPALARNVRNEIKRGRKIYFYDNGIRNAIIGNYNPIPNREDVGALWENFILSERMKYINNHQIYASAYFWRTTQKQEIDYIEERDGRFFACEIKWNPKKKGRLPSTFRDNYRSDEFEKISPKTYQHFLSELVQG
ncbi:MAG: ATP-binding protein [Candidatus Marinimicrobia bacterium]|nr:ATP-binding protein [Candidatus Neomarinimicrobiota bacterium]MCF7901968.1 ATP-binding protein [Candidatus Neomarinimicrobiota bacterium]